MIFLLIIVFAGTILYEVPGLIKNGYWRDLTIFFILSVTALTMSILYIYNIQIPNPVKGQEYLVKDLLHLNYK